MEKGSRSRRKTSLNIESCQEKQHFLAFLVNKIPLKKINNFEWNIPTSKRALDWDLVWELWIGKEEIKSIILEKHRLENRDESIS